MIDLAVAAVFARGLHLFGGLLLLRLLLAHNRSIRARRARDTHRFSRNAGCLSAPGGTGGDPRRERRSGS